MLNKVMLIGNVGSDVKTQTFKNGGMCAKFNLATQFKTKVNNEYVEHTTWHPIQVYGNSAQYAAEYIGTGDKVYVEGSIKVDNVEQSQQFRYVVVNHPSHRLLIVSKSSKHQQETQHTNSYNRNSHSNYHSSPNHTSYNNNNSNELLDDDFPF